MTNPAEDLHRKPYNDVEALYGAVLWAMEAYGKVKYPSVVLRTAFTLYPDTREFGGLPGWVLEARMAGHGDIPVHQAAEKVQLTDLHP